jgi:hypothetical protein
MELVPDIDRLTQIFSNAVAPSFFLGAIAAFVSLMMSRLGAVNARIKETRESPSERKSKRKPRRDQEQRGTWFARAAFAPVE